MIIICLWINYYFPSEYIVYISTLFYQMPVICSLFTKTAYLSLHACEQLDVSWDVINLCSVGWWRGCCQKAFKLAVCLSSRSPASTCPARLAIPVAMAGLGRILDKQCAGCFLERYGMRDRRQEWDVYDSQLMFSLKERTGVLEHEKLRLIAQLDRFYIYE
jgi:hypothetical protein